MSVLLAGPIPLGHRQSGSAGNHQLVFFRSVVQYRPAPTGHRAGCGAGGRCRGVDRCRRGSQTAVAAAQCQRLGPRQAVRQWGSGVKHPVTGGLNDTQLTTQPFTLIAPSPARMLSRQGRWPEQSLPPGLFPKAICSTKWCGGCLSPTTLSSASIKRRPPAEPPSQPPYCPVPTMNTACHG